MSIIPPYDRSVALPCRMSIFRERWLHVECGCGQRTYQHVRHLIAEDSGAAARTLAETVVRVRCTSCGKRPVQVHLAEEGRAPGSAGGAAPGWRILLHQAPAEAV